MTCIVGAVDGSRVVVGGDAGATNWMFDTTSVVAPKVVRVGEFLIGFAGSARMGQILSHDFTAPRRHGDTYLFAYMIKEFVPAVREAFKSGGWAFVSHGREEGGSFIVGSAGRLFMVQEDFSVLESRNGFVAIGCGGNVALGSLCETKDRPAEERVMRALEAAALLSAGVAGPFHIETVGDVGPTLAKQVAA